MKRGRCAAVKRSVAAGMLLLMLLLADCRGDAFEGSIVAEDDCFQMDYTLLSRQQDAALVLCAGDALRISVAQEDGTVDITVGMDGKEPIYEGKGLSDFAFTLNIAESGTYQITVVGHRARGSVSFDVQ